MNNRYGVPNTFFVRGVTKEPHCHIVPFLQESQLVWFEPEPENKYDRDAIAVMALVDQKASKIGYVPRELTGYLKALVEGTEEGTDVLYWNAHVSRLLKDDSGIGVEILFYSSSIIPKQKPVTDKNVQEQPA